MAKINSVPAGINLGLVLHKLPIYAATLGLGGAIVLAQASSLSATSRGGLWAVVQGLCLPAYQSVGVAFPCAEVDIANGLSRGFAVLRVPASTVHVLVVPTARISGIESPALQREDAPNYWQAAWDARRFVEEGAGRALPRDEFGMAINSAAGRSQDQLHIHVACIAPEVAAFLRRHQTDIHGSWAPLKGRLAGDRFWATKIESENLVHADPFKLLARALAPGRFPMGKQTLAVIGATFHDGKPGFYLLTNDPRAAQRDGVSAESLLDDSCGK
ncbi:MAG: CDP-diacylglycerol diphosphatase [Methylocapsa sp.]|nr:CDP-diacylglycerol diphosphatase [Methylocapsa sp.]